MNKISAKIIADSKNEWGERLTSFVVVFPRIVLAEFNTHRMLSRNSASSRAIPFEKMVKMVREDPFIPIKWMKDHSGMQGTEYFEGLDITRLNNEWVHAAYKAADQAEYLNEELVTKQLCNRLLEPFMWHTCIVTATEWENFLALRAEEAAEIHIQELAFRMLDEYNASTPKLLEAGEWHIPFGDDIDDLRVRQTFVTAKSMIETFKVKIATARCARVSYMNFEGKDDYEADIKLHDRLLASGHMSPFEHCAQAMRDNQYEAGLCDVKFMGGSETGDARYQYGWSGNFRGFIQYRKFIDGENKSDNRVKK